MNVAFFTNNYKPFIGGVPIAIENLANALRERGHHVHIFAPEYGDDDEQDADVFRTWSIKNFNESNFVLPIPLALSTYLTFNDVQADIVHVHHPFLLGMAGLRAARAEKLPVVFTYHTQYEKYVHYLPWDSNMVKEMAVGIATRFANSCDAVIAPSTDIKQQLESRGVDVPIRVIPTGINLEQFRSGTNTWLREKFAIPTDEKILLFLSRLAKEKNVEFLMDAFAQLTQKVPKLHFVLVGTGDQVEALTEQARAANLTNRVHFTGALTGTDVPSAYKSADVFVFASVTETQGMVVLEAMAGGCPVVAVDAPGVRDVIENDRNGFLLDAGDLNGFVARCRQLLEDDSLHMRFREAALERAKELSLTRTSQQVEALYEFVLENPHPERNERFLLVREFVRYHVNKLTETFSGLQGAATTSPLSVPEESGE
ncbi:MAG: glycosyltransferase family 4 protein [Candidatus Sumerlaeaceae bacterium]